MVWDKEEVDHRELLVLTRSFPIRRAADLFTVERTKLVRGTIRRAATAPICAMIVSPSLANSRPNRRLSPERTKRDKRRAENMLSNTGDPPLLNCRLKKAFNQGIE